MHSSAQRSEVRVPRSEAQRFLLPLAPHPAPLRAGRPECCARSPLPSGRRAAGAAAPPVRAGCLLGSRTACGLQGGLGVSSCPPHCPPPLPPASASAPSGNSAFLGITNSIDEARHPSTREEKKAHRAILTDATKQGHLIEITNHDIKIVLCHKHTRDRGHHQTRHGTGSLGTRPRKGRQVSESRSPAPRAPPRPLIGCPSKTLAHAVGQARNTRGRPASWATQLAAENMPLS